MKHYFMTHTDHVFSYETSFTILIFYGVFSRFYTYIYSSEIGADNTQGTRLIATESF